MFDLGQRLRTIRTAKKLSQIEAAKVIGSQKRNYQNYEYNHSEMGLQRLLRFLDYFNISADFFFQREKAPMQGKIGVMRGIVKAHLSALEKELQADEPSRSSMRQRIEVIKQDLGIRDKYEETSERAVFNEAQDLMKEECEINRRIVQKFCNDMEDVLKKKEGLPKDKMLSRIQSLKVDIGIPQEAER